MLRAAKFNGDDAKLMESAGALWGDLAAIIVDGFPETAKLPGQSCQRWLRPPPRRGLRGHEILLYQYRETHQLGLQKKGERNAQLETAHVYTLKKNGTQRAVSGQYSTLRSILLSYCFNYFLTQNSSAFRHWANQFGPRTSWQPNQYEPDSNRIWTRRDGERRQVGLAVTDADRKRKRGLTAPWSRS
jgi:hypothetical protein